MVDFADSSWFLPLVEEATSESGSKGSSHLTESHKTCLADRYFTTRYFTDAGGEVGNDLCVMQHSNRICVLGLAPGHHLFKGCRPVSTKRDKSADNSPEVEEKPLEEHKILGVDFQVRV